ncbi:MAG TPA: hypothetical protein VK662_13355 [Acidothermaceae bacterium]|jgi:hypothetical protein|nr:hypothetical protein [Acidothermaceae bacterium]
MKKSLSFALLTVVAALGLTACSSASASKTPQTIAPLATPGISTASFTNFNAAMAKITDIHPALEKLSEDTAALAAIEDTSFSDANDQNVPAFTADCAALKPLGATWNADLASIQANFPGVLSPAELDPSQAQLTLAELLAGCAPFATPSAPAAS